MLAKLTSKNQITLPKAAVSGVDAAEYFDVTVEGGRIILTPVRVQKAQATASSMSCSVIPSCSSFSRTAWARQ